MTQRRRACRWAQDVPEREPPDRADAQAAEDHERKPDEKEQGRQAAHPAHPLQAAAARVLEHAAWRCARGRRRGAGNGHALRVCPDVPLPTRFVAESEYWWSMATVPASRHLLRAKDLIDTRYLDSLDVRALAQAARLSSAHFSREFRRAFGETPHQYLLTRRLERAAALLRSTDRSVANPHVVCVTSRQYRDLGLANEIELVLAAFPALLRHDIVMSSVDLKRVLSSPVDIVHIAGYVCPRDGTLYFSAMKLPEGLSQPEGEEDRLTAAALTRLLQHAGTKLVVIASGDSLALISRLLPVVHVVSPQERISAKQMARWVEEFYQLLWTNTLAEACEIATAQSGAMMTMMSKQVVMEGAGAAPVDAANACSMVTVEPK